MKGEETFVESTRCSVKNDSDVVLSFWHVEVRDQAFHGAGFQVALFTQSTNLFSNQSSVVGCLRGRLRSSVGRWVLGPEMGLPVSGICPKKAGPSPKERT